MSVSKISAALYEQAKKRYSRFIGDIRPLVGTPGTEKDFGKQHVMKPSQLMQMIVDKHCKEDIATSMARAMRSPIYNEEGKIIALSMDADGTPITEEQFKREFPPKVFNQEIMDKEIEQFTDLVLAANQEIKAMAEAAGVTVTEVYGELNRLGMH